MCQRVKSLLKPNGERKYEKIHTGGRRTALVRNYVNTRLSKYIIMDSVLDSMNK